MSRHASWSIQQPLKICGRITTDSVVIRDREALESMLESKDEIESVLRDMGRKL